MKKKIRQTNFSPRGQDGYSIGAPTLHSRFCLKIHLLIQNSVGVPTLYLLHFGILRRYKATASEHRRCNDHSNLLM
jgi:hypothetical protein